MKKIASINLKSWLSNERNLVTVRLFYANKSLSWHFMAEENLSASNLNVVGYDSWTLLHKIQTNHYSQRDGPAETSMEQIV